MSISFGNIGISIEVYISGLEIILFGVNTNPWAIPDFDFGFGAVSCMNFREGNKSLIKWQKIRLQCVVSVKGFPKPEYPLISFTPVKTVKFVPLDTESIGFEEAI